jgi:hypothetical protein
MSAKFKLTNFVLLPELILEKSEYVAQGHKVLHCSKRKMQEYCPHCASGEYWTHEYRTVTIRDEPVRGGE